jgi:hypothetical protein
MIGKEQGLALLGAWPKRRNEMKWIKSAWTIGRSEAFGSPEWFP